MPRIMLVADQAHQFEDLTASLNAVPSVATMEVHTAEEALEMAAAHSPDLVIVDEYVGKVSALALIRRLMKVDAFMQTAAVSRQPHDAFHETSEGLGIMIQIPPRPGKFEAELILKTLKETWGWPTPSWTTWRPNCPYPACSAI